MFTPSETLFTFQFTPLREGRQEATEEQLKLFQFQFTPLREGRLNDVHVDEAGFAFQFTPLREGRRNCSKHSSSPRKHFNSRPSARGDCRLLPAPTPPRADFNSRPSARGDLSSATALASGVLFQFTPLREGRRQVSVTNLSPNHFNSRPSARGDGRTPAINRRRSYISIHAPPRGATCASSRCIRKPLFQFTPLREGRRSA